MAYEVVNKKDGSRMSRSDGKGSSTLFKSEKDAMEWMLAVGLSSAQYEAKETA